MKGKEVYARSVAAGLALFLGGCATPLKNEHPSPRPPSKLLENLDPKLQPKMSFNPGKCVKYAVDLAPGQQKDLADIEGNENYHVANRGRWVPPGSPKGKISLNTVEVSHNYEDNEGLQNDHVYVYNYGGPSGEVRFGFDNGDKARVAVAKMDAGTVAVYGDLCMG